MSKRILLTFGLFAAICVIVIPMIAFNKEGDEAAAIVPVESQDTNARDMFSENCGACHTLAAAGTDGVVGPDLDNLLAPGGIGNYEGNYARVLNAITCGIAGRMPQGILVGTDAKDVSAFVGAYAGQLGDDQGPLVDTATAPKGEPTPCVTS